MLGRKVQLFLKTPLYPFSYEDEGKTHTFPADIYVLQGEVTGEWGPGFWLKLSAIGRHSGKLKVELSGLSEVMVPASKVDFVRFID